jgi:NADH-quinone oxidoreductase subunit E
MFEIAMKMLFCLLIAALIGGLIGYLIGMLQKCEKGDDENNIKPFSNMGNYIPQQRFIESKTEEVEVEKVDENTLVTPQESEALLNIVKEESGLNENEKEPDLLKEPIDGKKDDLKEISGIGIKLEKVLNDLGIYHFEQIASWGEKELNWIDNHLVAFKGRARREKWVEQAKVLAEGGTTEFSLRVKKGEIDRY